MISTAEPTSKLRQQPFHGNAAVKNLLTIMAVSGIALREKTGFFESLVFAIGLDWHVSVFSTFSRR
jgi:hypothetical protein